MAPPIDSQSPAGATGPRRALITGITGQDGSYLAEFLLDRGYQVWGVTRRTSSHRFERIAHLEGQVQLVSADLLDQSSLASALAEVRPHEVYNLAAQSFVPTSWSQPVLTAEFTAVGVTRLLEAVRAVDPGIRFYQASSSEQFGKVKHVPQSEDTPFHPRSPYGVAKCYGHWITVNYRESYGLFACSGILFNHECVTAETPVIVRRGELLDILPIEDVVPHRTDPKHGVRYSQAPAEPLEVWDRGGWTPVEWMTATWNDPQRPDHKAVRRIAARGACFATTEEHVLFTAGAVETPAGKVRTGSSLELVELPEATERTSLLEDEAWLLGIMAAEGTASDRDARFVSAEEPLVEQVRACWERLTGGWATVRLGTSGFANGTPAYQVDLRGAPDYCAWLRTQLYTRRGSKRVPIRVLNAPAAARLAFLRGYNLGDGLRAGHGSYEFKSFKTNSAALAQGLWWLAHRTLGQRTILCIEDREDRTYYQINLNSPDTLGRKGAHLRRPVPEVMKVEEVKRAGWLFDLATASGTFHAGIGAGWMHNSPRRGLEFVTRKVTDGVARIALGLASELRLGNLDAKRDWGFAGDYVEAMWLMLQQPEPDDYVIATGETHSVRELVEIAFARAGLDWQKHVVIDEKLVRPAEVDLLLGDARKARERLGWKPRVSFRELVEMMVDADLARLRARA